MGGTLPGGFVPRDPTLDGPYFESSFNSVYHHQVPANTDTVSVGQASLPSITEPPKIVENGRLYDKLTPVPEQNRILTLHSIHASQLYVQTAA